MTSQKGTTKAADKAPKGSNKDGKPTALDPKHFIEVGWEDPSNILIMGLDVKEGDAGYDPELLDPDRIKDDPDEGFIKSLIEHGIDAPIRVQRVGKALYVVNGRQTVMGSRIANKKLKGENRLMVPWYIKPGAKATALDVSRANEFAKRDSPLMKARRAARLESLGYKTADIVKAFSDDGAKPISKMTLTNWKRLIMCCPSIQEKIQNGEIPVAAGYEIGKLTKENEAREDVPDEEKQLALVAKIEAEGGSFKGMTGRQNLGYGKGGPPAEGDDAEGDDEGGEDSGSQDDGKGGKNASGPHARSEKMSMGNIRRVAAVLSDDDEDPYDDRMKIGGKVVVREYQPGDYQRLAGAILAAITGDDPTGKALREFPSVYTHFKGVLRSPKGGDSEE